MTQKPQRQRAVRSWAEAVWSVLIGGGLILAGGLGIVLGWQFAQFGPFTIGAYGLISGFHLITQMVYAALNRYMIRTLLAMAQQRNFQPPTIIVRVGYREDPELDILSLQSLTEVTYQNIVAHINVVDGNEAEADWSMARNAVRVQGAVHINVDYALIDYIDDDATMSVQGKELLAQLAAQVQEALKTTKYIVISQPHRYKRSALVTGDLIASTLVDPGENKVVINHKDSDTIVDPDEPAMLALTYVADDVVGVTGRVSVIFYNVWTFLQHLRYGWAFDGERAAQSKRGFVFCQSGPSSSMVLWALMQIIYWWVVETFFGRRPHVGEDRQFSRMVSVLGRILYNHLARVKSEAPGVVIRIRRQIRRWSRSANRENPRTVPIIVQLKRDWWLLFDLFYNMFFPVFLLISISGTIFRAVYYGEWIYLAAWLVTIMLTGFLRSIFLVIVNRRLRYILFSLYGFFHVTILMWEQLFGMMTVYQSDVWVTAPRAEVGASRIPRWMWTLLYILVLIAFAIAVSLISPAPGAP